MWVAIDIQMKGRQFGLVKAIMSTSACVIMLKRTCVCVHMPGNTNLCVHVCLQACVGKKKRMIICVFKCECVCVCLCACAQASALQL